MSRGAQRVEGLPVRYAHGLAHLTTGDGPPVLLVPGYTGSKEDFGPLLAPLAAAGFRVTAVDLRGQLDSAGSGPAESYDPDGLAADLAAFLDGAPAHVVGHSYGGLVCRALTIARPDLVRSLTLLCSGPAALGGARASLMASMRAELVAGGVERIAPLLRGSDGAETFDAYRFAHSDPTALLGMGDALLAAPDRVAELAGTLATQGIPAFVCCGADDDAWPPAVQERMAADLGAGYAEIPGAGHSPAIDRPDEVAAALVRFWV